jgi:hypothetical protein
MSVKVIRSLLASSGPLTSLVPAAHIMAGTVPEATQLPAIGITEVSLVPVSAIDAQAEFSLVASRIQVTIMTKDYPSSRTILDEVRRACNFARGEIAGVDVASIVRDTVGPDLSDDAAEVHFKSIDFKVTYHEQN